MRGSIRSEILENIPMSILLVPFIAIRYAGDYHPAALIFGLAFFVVYAAVIYGYAGGQSGRLHNYGSDIATSGYRIVDMCVDAGKLGRFLMVVYIIRFMIRAGFAVYVVSLLVNNMVSFWFAAVSFILICMYGASGSFANRRVQGNILIWWMLTPLILLAVFSLSRMDYGGIAGEFRIMDISLADGNVFRTAWRILAVMSSFELVLFSFGRTRKNERRQGMDIIRVAVWLGVSVVLAYVYVLGMLGSRYVESGIRISFGNKLDYVLALAWLIGGFFVISSYIFYVKEMLRTLMDDENYVNNQPNVQSIYSRSLMYGLIFAVTLFFVCCFHYDSVRQYMISWLIYADVVLSLLLPFVISLKCRMKH
jgi:hypothetical protein